MHWAGGIVQRMSRGLIALGRLSFNACGHGADNQQGGQQKGGFDFQIHFSPLEDHLSLFHKRQGICRCAAKASEPNEKLLRPCGRRSSIDTVKLVGSWSKSYC